jgi:hypothetical protein
MWELSTTIDQKIKADLEALFGPEKLPDFPVTLDHQELWHPWMCVQCGAGYDEPPKRCPHCDALSTLIPVRKRYGLPPTTTILSVWKRLRKPQKDESIVPDDTVMRLRHLWGVKP